MTKDERLTQTILSLKMGKLSPLWGIVIGRSGRRQCECRLGVLCKTPGKHPRFSLCMDNDGIPWDRPTSDPEQIIVWQQIYPNANYAVHPREADPDTKRLAIVAMDLDYNAAKRKYGPAEIDLLAEFHGESLPATISVLSGRNSFSRHDYWGLPEGIDPANLSASGFNGVDLRTFASGVCVAPGGRHQSGNDYRFAEEYSPFEIERVPIFPGWLIPYFYDDNALQVDFLRDRKAPPTGSIAPGRYRPNDVVMNDMRRDKVAGPLLAGSVLTRSDSGKPDRSKTDYTVLCRLALYTAHDWGQFCFLASPLLIKRHDEKYVTSTADRAFLRTRFNFEPKKRPRTFLPTGRPRTDDTSAVIQAITDNPGLKPADIAIALAIQPSKVYNILSRYRRNIYRS